MKLAQPQEVMFESRCEDTEGWEDCSRAEETDSPNESLGQEGMGLIQEQASVAGVQSGWSGVMLRPESRENYV